MIVTDRPTDGVTHRVTHRVTLIPGDGTGPELAEALETVLAASGVAIAWERHEAGLAVLERCGTPLPDEVIDSIRATKVAIKGPITTPVGSGFRSVNVALRKALDLYACLRPAKSLAGVPSRYAGIDLVVVRENTEDLYAGIEHQITPDVAESIKITTRAASERIARFAFDYARAHGRHKVTAVHKANIMKLTDGLFLRVTREVAGSYPDLAFDDCIVDNLCQQLVLRPERFDVLVAPNLYGDIVSDLCAGLIGGPGVAPGANIGAEAALFEAVHGSGPDIAGQNVVNPTAFLLSGVLMLEHLGETEAAGRVYDAVAAVIAEGRRTTADLGGTAGTREFARAVVARLS
jgi:isocitrate dehydrogenase (NAD+)